MKMVRLTGLETEEELKNFDEVEGEHPRTGKPLIGKTYRRIKTRMPLSEMKVGKKNILKKEDHGTYSFISRPDYIRTSQMDIVVMSTKKAGELQALKAAQLKEAIELFSVLLPHTQATEINQDPILTKEDLPPIKDLIDAYMECLGIKGKAKVKGGTDDQIDKLQAAFKKTRASIQPVSVVAPMGNE